MKKNKSQYIIRKYVMASSAIEAIRMDKKTFVHDVWIDEKWKEMKAEKLEPVIGFLSEDEEKCQ